MTSEYGDTRQSDSSLSSGQRGRKERVRQDNVPRHIGLIEPLIGGSVAFYTAFVALAAYPDRPVLWAFVAMAAALALWSWQQPARRQGTMLLRGIAFVTIACVLLSIPRFDAAGGAGALYFWVTIPCILYSFLLRAPLASALVGATLAAFAISIALTGEQVLLTPVLLRAGFVVVFSVAAIRMGTMLRRTDELLEARRIDSASGMFNEYGLIDYGTDTWNTCRQMGLPACLVFIDVPDIRKLREIYGNAVARSVSASVSESISRLDTGKNVLARLALSRFALLVPDATREQAWSLVGEKLGAPPKIQLFEDGFDMEFPLGVHVVENRLQGIPFPKFYEAELDALDSAPLRTEGEATASASDRRAALREGPATTVPMELGT